MSIRSKRDLSRYLSKLKQVENRSVQLEQYPTPPHIVAEWIWDMAEYSDIAGKIILDAGCGNGVLGIALLLMGARKVYFMDVDQKSINITIENYNELKEEYDVGVAEFIVEDISLFDEEVDIVVQNPPFGTKQEHADKKFLEKAFSIAKIVYSMHKWSTESFIVAISRDHGFRITDTWRYDFPIKSEFDFHTKPVKNVDVALWRMERD